MPKGKPKDKPNLSQSFSQLPLDVKNALVRYYGSQEKVIEYFVTRFGTYATEIIDSLAKRNDKLGTNDPLIGVNVTTGKVHFNHLAEFNAFPWDEYHPRSGGHIEALKMFKVVNYEPGDTEEAELRRVV